MGATKRFSDLPVETVIRILSFLALEDLLSFFATNRFNHTICTDIVAIQYHSALLQYGMVNGRATLDVPSKLALLNHKEHSWRQFSPSHPADVAYFHQASSLYELESGFYISGVSTTNTRDPEVSKTTGLCAFDLKAFTEHGGIDMREYWRNVKLGMWGYDIVEMGVGLKEFDLIALVTKKDGLDVGEGAQFDIHLLQFSTSDPHPLAKISKIRLLDFVPESISTTGPSSTVLVSGRYLIILLKWRLPPRLPLRPDMLFVIDWWTGNIITRKEDLNREIGDIAFLSNDLIVIPNISTGRLEVARLPNIHTYDVQTDLDIIFVLVLPYLRTGERYRSAHCRSSCNPSGEEIHDRQERSSRIAYDCDPEKALVVTRFSLEGNGGFDSSVFWMIFRRSDLLDLVRTHSYKNYSLHRPPGIRRDLIIPWEDWGPQLTRWRHDKEMSFWMTTSSGQRLAILHHNRVHLWDFNPYAVKKARWEAARSSDSLSNAGRVVDAPTILRPRPTEPQFVQDVVSGLPFVEREFEVPQEYQGIHLDEEHLIAFNTAYPSNTIVQDFTVFPI